ncbi:hypothetical protein QUF72_14135 [Desulfobacterales bacterium HSG2]|nr:hypothetical protein [Desulfobacterales bacterium HSG2]
MTGMRKTGMIFGAVLIYVLAALGTAGAREILPGQETVRTCGRTGGSGQTPPAEPEPCGESARQRGIPGKPRKRRKCASRPSGRKIGRGKKKKKRKQGGGSLKKTAGRKKGGKETKREKKLKKDMIFSLRRTVSHYFPDLFDRIGELEDCRKKRHYELAEVIMACVLMFIFKKGSRNAMNNECSEEIFGRNCERIFGLRLSHMDTVDKVMRMLDESQLEKLKTELVRVLINRKTFRRHRISGTYYRIAVDATRVMNVGEGHCDRCLHRTSKKGKVTYFHNVLEAKLVCGNGFCISLGTEWVENPEGDYDKQDCELKAFARLAKKLGKDFPRLPICVVADGLYPNQTFFRICEDQGWAWIVTFKDGNLPTVWEDVLGLQKITEKNMRRDVIFRRDRTILRAYEWINNIDYHGFELNWFECVEEAGDETKRFVYISSLETDWHSVLEMTESGRMRWKIENEGFDAQKNHGYGLGHKYSEVSMTAMRNYYQCMQIAHMINQLFELSSLFRPLLTGKMTVCHLWAHMLGEMRHRKLSLKKLGKLMKRRIQLRYE